MHDNFCNNLKVTVEKLLMGTFMSIKNNFEVGLNVDLGDAFFKSCVCSSSLHSTKISKCCFKTTVLVARILTNCT